MIIDDHDQADESQAEPYELSLPDGLHQARDVGLTGRVQRGEAEGGQGQRDADQRPVNVAESGHCSYR